MPTGRGLQALLSRTAILAALACGPTAQAGNGALGPDAGSEGVRVRFDQSSGQTRIAGRASTDVCFAFSLPHEWRQAADSVQPRLQAVSSGAEIEIVLRSARELRHLPQQDLASRDAALLQQDYEGLLGRPAQAVSLTSSGSGATLWSATWVDPHLPTDATAMTVETLIVPLSATWVLELSLSNIGAPDDHDALLRKLLSGLRVQGGTACGI